MTRPKVLGEGRLNIPIVRCGPLRFPHRWDPLCGISLKCLHHDPHLFCGGVPGPPRASSPEFQSLPGPLHGKEPCSSGACSLPLSHRGEGQGNMPRLEGGKGKHAPLHPLLPWPPTPPALPRPGPPASPHLLPVSFCWSRRAQLARPLRTAASQTPTLSALPGHVASSRWGSSGRPLSAGSAQPHLPSAPCEWH